MQIELWKDNAIEFRGKFCYMWLMVLKPIYKQFIESCICPMLYRKSDVTLFYGTREAAVLHAFLLVVVVVAAVGKEVALDLEEAPSSHARLWGK